MHASFKEKNTLKDQKIIEKTKCRQEGMMERKRIIWRKFGKDGLLENV